ncbi:hypothetical protein [Paenibacillus radicis (ex Gao et al. 2016)]|uniref:DUF2178 domain-containing protein n=1 Tax=Paenibacillus radicis (ex Gao et al. 2016) TaxID=1737354 RepID=A0A917LWD0_9BACL|nr:hypothetical protein [Paenibacillus radicis (ex Gao et al. 2016)]GGG59498.1 hypothetical protein GCM10010918_10860 [Paenibacillus radicis (ex Gao et al. 2016)]
MTYHAKKASVSVGTSILVFFFLYTGMQGAANEGLDTLSSLWGAFFIKLLVVEVVANIIIIMIFNLINKLATNESSPSFADERDRGIELKAIRNFCFIFCFGFFVAMGALMLHQPLSAMFQILAFDFFISGLVLNLSFIFYYQRGF